MSEQLRDNIALALLKAIPYDHLLEEGLTAYDVMNMPQKELARHGAFESASAAGNARDEALKRGDEEAEFVLRNSLRVYTPMDEDYPRRLSVCNNAPRIISVCGRADLNCRRALAVVGTRHCTPYGTTAVDRIIRELAEKIHPVTIVSGLAFGIDAAAHKAALDFDMPTIGVVSHGLDMIYPAAHRDLATQIVDKGGALVTEYLHGTKPYRNHFLQRNGVIAMLSDATLVAESDLKGGAMSTAAQALQHGRVVLALPGRIYDTASAGCNHLIRKERAHIALSADDIIEEAGWPQVKEDKRPQAVQQSLFDQLGPERRLIAEYLRGKAKPVSCEEISLRTNLPLHEVLEHTTEMEFMGQLLRYPGGALELTM